MDNEKVGFVPIIHLSDGDSFTGSFYETYEEAELNSDIMDIENDMATGAEILHLKNPLEYPDEDYTSVDYVEIEEMTYGEYLMKQSIKQTTGTSTSYSSSQNILLELFIEKQTYPKEDTSTTTETQTHDQQQRMSDVSRPPLLKKSIIKKRKINQKSG